MKENNVLKKHKEEGREQGMLTRIMAWKLGFEG